MNSIDEAPAENPDRPSNPGIGERKVVLVFQGGGALGAYQAGVYEALHAAGVEPDWVIGTSIGAVNAALIAGNPPDRRVDRLREFWRSISHRGPATFWPGPPGFPTAWTTLGAVVQGLPGFFRPHPPAWLGQHLPLEVDATGYYRTDELRQTLSSLVEIERFGSGQPRMTVGAVNVATGEMRYFDSREDRLDLEHVLASGALPPAFPPVRIGEEHYWDGGIYSNTPAEVVFDDPHRHSSLVFAVQLWRPRDDLPRTMWQVAGRQKDIQYASRVDSHVRRQEQIHRLRHVVRELGNALPPEVRSRPEMQRLLGYGCETEMHLVRLVAPALPDEDHTKDLDFHPDRVQARWAAGVGDAGRALARRAWLAPSDSTRGMAVHDQDEDRPAFPR